MPVRPTVSRAQWLGHRWRRHGFAGPLGVKQLDDLLLLGVQDGRQHGAVQALAQRLTSIGRTPIADAIRVRGPLTVGWTYRTAPHAHRLAQLPSVRAALAPLTTDDGGDSQAEVVDRVAAAMQVMGPTPKGEVSTAVGGRVPDELLVWCGTCQARHVPDGTFRAAAFQAGLVLDPAADGTVLRPSARAKADTGTNARRTILDAYLRVNGPTTKAAFGDWFGVGTRAMTPLWTERDWVGVKVDGVSADLPADVLHALGAAPPAEGVRLVPSTDPYLRQAPKTWVLPDKAHRAELFKPIGGPGALLVDGEVAGTWRYRKDGSRLTISTFTKVPASHRDDAAASIERLRAALGGDDIRPDWS